MLELYVRTTDLATSFEDGMLSILNSVMPWRNSEMIFDEKPNEDRDICSFWVIVGSVIGIFGIIIWAMCQ